MLQEIHEKLGKLFEGNFSTLILFKRFKYYIMLIFEASVYLSFSLMPFKEVLHKFDHTRHLQSPFVVSVDGVVHVLAEFLELLLVNHDVS